MIEFERPLPEEPVVDDLVERYRAITIERAAMRKLKEHPGWKPYMAIVKGNLDTINNSLNVTMIGSMEHALHLNFEKGKAFALQMMCELIEACDNAYEQELQKLEVLIEEKRHGGRNDGDSRGDELPTEPEQLSIFTSTNLSAP